MTPATAPDPHDLTHQDFLDADRGFLGARTSGIVTNDDGSVVWDNDAYAFLDAPCPPTAHPSLWRQGRLAARQGLYEVVPGIYQVRGLDLSNMTLVEGDEGVVVIDPLISKETAAAALELYRQHRGHRPVTGVIYTHAHVDHFGGVHGVWEGVGPIIAPDGFMESAVAENVYAGVAMSRRALFMYGMALEKSPTGQIGCGLGMATSQGSIGLLAPTVLITRTGQEEIVDGVRMIFQSTPGTECPAEMNFYFPDHRALCMAENATRNLHNLVTLRGAVVRDARVWATYLDESIEMFAQESDVAFASHHWPTWGHDAVVEYLSLQRDLYAYLHDQTLRYVNEGLTGSEIAEVLAMPPQLEASWHTHGYYGSVSHNVKAIYQRYLGWFDGNPANLWQHPPVARAERYVAALGGSARVIELAAEYVADGDHRFAAELLNHAVFADETDEAAREALAEVYTHLGYGSENATWRNFYLTGAQELRTGVTQMPPMTQSLDMLNALTISQALDALAIRIDGPRAWKLSSVIDWHFTDADERHRTTLRNGVLTHRRITGGEGSPLVVTLTKLQFFLLIVGLGVEDLATSGDRTPLLELLAVVTPPDRNFAIVTP